MAKERAIDVVVCIGLNCSYIGALDLLETLERQMKLTPGKTTQDGTVSLQTAACTTRCADGPNVDINGCPYIYMEPEKLLRLVDESRRKS